jgi:tRNA(His) guanylyltransferase
MLARAHFSHKECEGKNGQQLQDMLHEKGINWNDASTRFKRGRCVVKRVDGWVVDNEIPVFSQDRAYIERHVYIHKEEA